MSTDAFCRFLDWDTDFFQRRIARIVPHRITEKSAKEILEWCEKHKIDCLYFLAEIDDSETTGIAEANGFHFADVRVTMQKVLEGLQAEKESSEGIQIRLSSEDDIPALQKIAGASHRDSRFYFDPNFPRSVCDRLYQTWIQKSCLGYADAVFVALMQDLPVGYISCHLVDPQTAHIGLIAVDSEAQGQGVGKRLISETSRWCTQQGRTQLTVVTQGRNSAAQRLYQRCGFLTLRMQAWYHKWFSAGRPPQS
jgi:dTDP-4-amino-4,6-dideoxy-D-galactose acyltransferase